MPAWLSMTPSRDIAYIDRTSEWTDRTVHFNRLLRDGWTLQESEPYRTLWARPHPSRPLTLHMMHALETHQSPGLRYVVEYYVSNETEGREQVIGPATWADWDQHGRLVVARDGKLFQWRLESGAPEEITDFNGHEPDPQAPPASATSWPVPPR